MSLRRDKVEISIAFLTDESREYAKLVAENQQFIKELKQAQKEGKDLTEVVTKMAQSGQAISKIPLDKLAPTQLVSRAKQLEQALKLIPQSAPQYKVLEGEFKAINNELAAMRARTKGVAEAQQQASAGAGFFSKALAGIGAVVGGLGIVQLISMVISFGKSLFDTGTQMDALKNKTSTVFGEAESVVRAFAENNARALGLTKQEYVNLATSVGDLLVPMGFTKEAAAKLSAELVNQGGILSEWTGGKVSAEEATQILNKALLGERDALNQLGLDVKDSLIQDELKKRGMDKLTGEAKRQAEAIITLKLVTEQSTSANEAFAKNTDSLVRKKAQLRAQVSEVVERLSNGLVPIFAKVISISGPIIERLVSIATSVFDLGEKLKIFKIAGGIFNFLSAAITTALDGLGSIADGIVQVLDGEFVKAAESFGRGFKNITFGAGVEGGKAVAAGWAGGIADGTDDAKKEGDKFTQAVNDSMIEAQLAGIKKNGKKSREEQAKESAKHLEARLKQIELEFGREEIAIDQHRLDRLINESEHGAALREAKKRMYEEQLKVLRDYHHTESKEYIEAQKKLLELQAQTQTKPGELPAIGRSTFKAPTSQTPSGGGESIGLSENAAIRDKFRRQVINELEFNQQLANLRVDSANKRLDLLRQQGLAETDEFKKALKEQTDAQIAAESTRLENKKRTRQLEQLLSAEGLRISADAIDIGIDLLSKDEVARKKHAGALKVLEMGKIAVNLASEIQGIWRNANSNPINALIPGWGSIFAGIQTAFAVARSAVQTKKVQSAKFFGGGHTGMGFGLSDETGHRPAGIVHANEWVSPAWMVRHPVYGQTVALLEHARRKGYAAGGYTDTTPVSDTAPMPSAAGAQSFAFEALLKETTAMRRDISQWQSNLRVWLPYTDVEQRRNDIETIRAEASV